MNELEALKKIERRKSIARELIFALTTALVAFDLLPGEYSAPVVAGLVALTVIVWGIAEKQTPAAAYGSLIRKLAVAAGGIAIKLDYISDAQAATLLSLVAAVLATFFGIRASEETAQEKAMRP